MVTASIAVHVLIGGGVALSCFSGTAQKVPDRAPLLSTLTLLPHVPQPVHPASAPAATKPAEIHPLALSQPVTPPLTSPPQVAASRVKPPGLPVLAKMEANPNALAPTSTPDSVLAPVPAPKLDGTKGVVFILDISGSMYEPFAGTTRLAFAREALSQRVRALPDNTPFAVVLYARKACSSGPLVAANAATRDAAVRFLMRDVNCDGGTNLAAGLAAARALNTGALILATDGDLNVSCSDLMIQAQEILGKDGNAPSLLVLGIAPRPNTTADHLLQDLADLESGTYSVEQTPDETALR